MEPLTRPSADSSRRNYLRADRRAGIDSVRSAEISAHLLRRLSCVFAPDLRSTDDHFESRERSGDIFARCRSETRSCDTRHWYDPRGWGVAELAADGWLAQCAAMAAVLRAGAGSLDFPIRGGSGARAGKFGEAPVEEICACDGVA